MTNDLLPLLIVMLATVGCSANAKVVSIDLRSPNEVSKVGWQPQSDIDLLTLEGPIKLQLTLPDGHTLTRHYDRISLTNDGDLLTGLHITKEGDRRNMISGSAEFLTTLGLSEEKADQWKQDAIASRPNLRLQKIFKFNNMEVQVSLRGSTAQSQAMITITLPRTNLNNSD